MIEFWEWQPSRMDGFDVMPAEKNVDDLGVGIHVRNLSSAPALRAGEGEGSSSLYQG